MPERLGQELSDRERTVLRYVVHDFIQNATPIGSRYISKRHEDVIGLSSASIRNIMSDLEGMGYLNHPHASAGRIPTDLGYRVYLNTLIELDRLSSAEQDEIRRNLDEVSDREELLRIASKLLSRISRQLSIVSAPDLQTGTFEKTELIQLSPNRILVVISITAGLVRTIMMELPGEVQRDRLEEISRVINERLSGLSLAEIRETFSDRMKEAWAEEPALVRLFIESVDRLFQPDGKEKIHVAGADTILDHPEFGNPQDLRGIIELVNNEEMIVHLLQKTDPKPNSTTVRIGMENEDDKLRQYSLIASGYSLGNVTGSIGLLGPTRMQYARMIPLVEYVARTISEMFRGHSSSSTQ